MIQVRPIKILSFAVCILMLSSLPTLYADASPSISSEEGSLASGHLRISAHDMTMSEMLELRDAFGVRNSSAEYNVIVDGFGTGLAPPSEEEWLSMVGTVKVLDSIESDLGDLPSSIDLSTLPTFPAVGNQRSQPSCSAWAGAYYAYGFQEAVDQGWDQASEGAPDQLMSPAWTYNKVNGGKDAGSWIDQNMMIVADWGAATLATMPFDEYEFLDWGSPDAFREAPAHRAAEVFTIDYTGQPTIDQIKTLVTDGVPVTFAIDATEFNGAFADDNFIISSAEYSSTILNHAQTIVGFDDTVTDDGEIGAFRVVNSWGASWGDSGYYWLTYDALMWFGEQELDVLNYVTDIENYSPSIVLTWHFNSGPSRSAGLEVGVGSPSAPAEVKIPFFSYDTTASHLYPDYMCLDVTEFSDEYSAGEWDFYITLGSSSTRGILSSFKVGLHEGIFVPGNATQSSGQSEDVPIESPCTATVSLEYYAIIDADDAMDAFGLEFSCAGGASWVAVDHHSQKGADSMQSGDIADLESTSIQTDIEGPASVSFYWKVSSESGNDVLSFSVIGAGIEEHASGDTDWEEVSAEVGAGLHTFVWDYSKDSSTDSLDDTAWIDSLTVSQPMPSFSIEPTYEANYSVPLLVTPADVYNPMGGDVSFWYVWGDGAECPGDPMENWSASHAYTSLGDFDLTVYMDDDYGSNVSEQAEVTVMDANQKPEILSIDVEPGVPYHEPGNILWVNITVIDVEGDDISIFVDFGDGDTDTLYCMDIDPDTPLTASANHTYVVGDENPFVIDVIVSDSASHAAPGWNTDSVEIMVNTAPTASFTVDPVSGATGAMFSFDASDSSDPETSSSSIEVRWDWDGDGLWDTSWSVEKTATHAFMLPGWYDVMLEVRDANGLNSTATIAVEVTGEPIPEFQDLLIPVLALMAIFAIMRRRRDSDDEDA